MSLTLQLKTDLPLRNFETIHKPGGIVERWWSDEKGNITRTVKQESQPIIDAVHAVARDGGAKGKNAYYMGSIPEVLALEWARECGAAIGTREFANYCRKQLLSGNFSKLATGLN